MSALATTNNPTINKKDRIIAKFLFDSIFVDASKHKLYIKLMITIINNEKGQEHLAEKEGRRSNR